jgi:hypothetical protein
LAKPRQNIPVHPVNLPSWRRVRLAAYAPGIAAPGSPERPLPSLRENP